MECKYSPDKHILMQGAKRISDSQSISNVGLIPFQEHLILLHSNTRHLNVG